MEDYAIKTALIGALLSLFLGSLAYLVSDVIVKKYNIKKYYLVRLTAFFIASLFFAIGLFFILWIENPARAKILIADFSSGYAYNEYGAPFQDFSDNLHHGNSGLTYKVIKENNTSNYRMHISFYLGEECPQSPYCGVFSDMSLPPQTAKDASQYEGIEFSVEQIGGIPNDVRYIIQCATFGIHDGAYHEYDFTEKVNRDKNVNVVAPFRKFEQPYFFSGEKDQIDRSKLFRIGFIIRGPQGFISNGELYIDNIKFY